MNYFRNAISSLGKSFGSEVKTPVLIGGWAVSMLGCPRHTVDFDFLIDENDYDKLAVILSRAGYREVTKTSIHARFKAASEEESTIPFIDCLFADTDTYESMQKQGKIIRVFDAEFILPDPCHIIAMKLHSLKYRGELEGARDISDILALIEIHRLDLSDGTDFEKLCRKYASEEIFRKLKNEQKSHP